MLVCHICVTNDLLRGMIKSPCFHWQPVFSPSVLAEMMRPDGSSTIPVLPSAESLSAELAHELIGIQVNYKDQMKPNDRCLLLLLPVCSV